MRAFLLGVAAVVALGAAAHAENSSVAKAFGQAPAIDQIAISPGGAKLAMIGTDAAGGVLTIVAIDGQGAKQVRMGNVGAHSVYWVGDDYMVARVAYWRQFGPQRYRFLRNVVVGADGRVGHTLLAEDESAQDLIDHRFLGVTLGPKPRGLMLGVERVSTGRALVVWSVDPETGHGEIVAWGDKWTRGFGYDSTTGVIHRRQANEKNDTVVIETRSPDGTGWRPVWTSLNEAEAKSYAGYSSKDQAAYLRDSSGPVAKFVARRADQPAAVEFMPGSPLSAEDMFWNWQTDQPIAVLFGGEAAPLKWLDAELAKVEAVLVKSLPGRQVRLFDWSADRSRYVVRAYGQDAVTSWYLFDRTRRELSPLGEAAPALKGIAFGTTHWTKYPARDGALVPALVTLPPGATDASRGLPLIVLPHDGPDARDDSTLNFTVQFLASSGYVVFRPQYRGSKGFGEAWRRAGEAEWAGKIQSDVLDGIAALATKGLVDPKRVCIVGGGFAGYLSLTAARLHPESYRCAVSIGGVSDLRTLVNYKILPRTEETRDMLGWREALATLKSGEKLDALSPARHADQVAIPVLLIHGENDEASPLAQSKLMRDALAVAGKPVEYVMLPDGDYSLSTTAARTQMLEALRAFLEKQLPVNQALSHP